MEKSELKLECELLNRRNKNLIMGLMFSYISLYLFTRFLTPSYMKRKLIYKGLLKSYNMEEYLPATYLLQLALLLGAGYAFWNILTLTLRINGIVRISEDTIEIVKWKKFSFFFRTDQIKNLKVQFNYFKKNDTEPRNMVTGNNNLLEFSRYHKTFKFEFLLQTEEEDEKFRRILESWENKGITFEYKTVLTDF